jgi:hypothetical protein
MLELVDMSIAVIRMTGRTILESRNPERVSNVKVVLC